MHKTLQSITITLRQFEKNDLTLDLQNAVNAAKVIVQSYQAKQNKGLAFTKKRGQSKNSHAEAPGTRRKNKTLCFSASPRLRVSSICLTPSLLLIDIVFFFLFLHQKQLPVDYFLSFHIYPYCRCQEHILYIAAVFHQPYQVFDSIEYMHLKCQAP